MVCEKCDPACRNNKMMTDVRSMPFFFEILASLVSVVSLTIKDMIQSDYPII